MEGFICNRCNVPWYRGKTPFSITQCGHIYCQACITKAEKKCPQCQNTDLASVPLAEPLREPRIAGFFKPLGDSLAELQKVETFQSGQAKIMARRFYDIDKKYETLKSQYMNTMRHCKVIHEKYQKLKVKEEQLEKRLKQFTARNSPINTSSEISTPYSANGPQRYAVSLQFSGSHTEKRQIYSATGKRPETRSSGDRFQIPTLPAPRSVGSYLSSTLSSGYSGQPRRNR